MNSIELIELDDRGDQRGILFNIDPVDLDYLDSIKNIHIGKIGPNSVRGNHYHLQHKEILVISYSDCWKLFWTIDGRSKIQKREFEGSGAVLAKIDPDVAHAILNTGRKDLEMVAISENEYNPADPDTYRQILITN